MKTSAIRENAAHGPAVHDLITEVSAGNARPDLRLLPGGRAHESPVSKNDCRCEICARALKIRPIAGFESAWTELDDLVGDVRTHRMRVAYLCESCGWRLYEEAA